MNDFMHHIPSLIVQYLNETISDTDRIVLEKWAGENEQNRLFLEQYKDQDYVAAELNKIYAYDHRIAWKKFENRIVPAKKVVELGMWRRLAVAAVIVLFLSATAYWWIYYKGNSESASEQAQRFKNDVAPGSAKAQLILADGSIVLLDSSAKNGLLKKQQNVLINKKQEGELVYTATSETVSSSLEFNKLSTPIGGQYKLTLPDGTKVWLNAASSIRYPAQFAPDNREVEITGEVYFEVAAIKKRDGKIPFTVHAGNMDVQVLGTKFNINAYTDESAAITSLLEGSVRIQQNKKQAMLHPGEQALIVAATDNIRVNTDENIDDNIAWVNNYFQFNDADIEHVMRQISRWYDISVQYDGKVAKRFTGTIPRSISIVNLLKILEATGGASFTVEGKLVTVAP
ncbi:MAG: FecR family protein [Chitinophagaceae bacterium]